MKRPAKPSFSATMATSLAPLRARWFALSARERYLSTLAASAVGILLFWALALAPALRSLQKVQAQRAVLDVQLQQMLVLQAEAKRLAALPHIGRDAALKALQESVAALGSGAQMQVSGDRAAVSLHGIPAASVAGWLGQARTDARVAPVEVRLVRSAARVPAAGARPPVSTPMATPIAPGNFPPPSAADTSRGPSNDDIRWDGTMVLVLPAT